MTKFLLVLIVLLLALTACASQSPSTDLPTFVTNAPAHYQEAYRFAVSHQHELTKYPCYCGCVAMGHADNLACFIQKTSVGGTIVYDQHASGCGVCVDIALDVKRLMGEGWTAPDIRAYIDETYSRYGPPTHTPLPMA